MNAKSFAPERWLPLDKNDAKRSFLPFSLGSRNCIGRYLALMVIRIVVCNMILRYDIELVAQNADLLLERKSNFLWDKVKLEVRLHPAKLQ